MKVVFVCEGFRPGVDACAKRMGVFVDRFRAVGHEVVVLASVTNLEFGDAENEVTYCRTCPMKRKTAVRRLMNNLRFPFSAMQENHLSEGADVVVVTSPPLLATLAGMRIASREHAKLVLDVRDIWPEIAFQMGSFSPKSVYGRVFARLAHVVYRRADLITAVTLGKIEKLNDILLSCGTDPSKLALIENGLDENFTGQNQDDKFAEVYPSLRKGCACVYVGNLGLAQGLEQILDLAEDSLLAYPKMEFLIFGKGADETLLKRSKEERGLNNVRFCGMISSRQAFTALTLARMAFVSLKNTSMTSSIPTKLYEALGVGCPVLLVADGNATAILDETAHGIQVSPRDREAIFHAFSELIREEDKYRRNRERAAKIVAANHSRQDAACEFERIVVSLVTAAKDRK